MVRRIVLGVGLATSLLAAAVPVTLADTGQPDAIVMVSNCVGGSSVVVTDLQPPAQPGPDAQFLSFVRAANCISTMRVVVER